MIQNILDLISSELGHKIPAISFDGKTFYRFGKKDNCWIIGNHFIINKCDCYIVYYGDFSKNISRFQSNIDRENLLPYSKNQLDFHFIQLNKEIDQERDKLHKLLISKWKDRLKLLYYNSHSYIEYKKTKPYDTVTTERGELIIPIYDVNDTLKGIQKIFSMKGESSFIKIFEKGSLVQGNFLNLNKKPTSNEIFVSEGFATAATIQDIFPEASSICVFTANNLAPTVQKIRTLFPNKKILICADRDKSQTGEKEALKASALITNCYFVLPHFKISNDQHSDFNDLFLLEGHEEVFKQINTVISTFDEHLFDLDIKAGFTFDFNNKRIKNKDRLREYFDYKYNYFVSGGYVYGYDQTHFSIFDDTKIAEFAQRMYYVGGTVDNKDILEFVYLVRRTNLKNIEHFKPARGFNFTNGFLPLDSDLLQPHSPGQFQFNVIPHPYITSATAQTWEQALNNTSCGDNSLSKIIEEYIGFILSNDEYILHPISLILDGYGNNGKTTLFTAIRNICGVENTSSASIADLSKNRFALSCLRNKMVNFDEEASSDIFRDSEIFKKITGGSSLQAEEKYKSSYEHINRAKIVISYNIIPIINDVSNGMARRLMFIPCNQDYGAHPHLKIHDIDSKLLNEASGIINLAVKAYKMLCKRGTGFTFSTASEDRKNEVLKISNPLIQWIECHINITNNPDDKVTIKTLYESFVRTTKSQITINLFSRQLNARLNMIRNIHQISHKDIKVNGKTQKGITGIVMT